MMSNENFDKRIKEKLENFKPEYQAGAWGSFKKHLPVPWYMHFFRNYGAWLFGGLVSTALVYTLWDNSNQTKILNDEISTLSNQVQNQTVTDTVLVNKYFRDTVYVKKFVDRYISLPKQQAGSKYSDRLTAKSTLVSEAEYQEFKAWKEEKQMLAKIEKEPSHQTALPETKAESKKETTEEREPPKKELEKLLAKADSVAEEQIPVVENVPKKTINWPKMRAGISSDYVGLNIFTTGPVFETFLTDKVSLNAGVLFSGQIETKHPQEQDFNQITGKTFEDQYVNQFAASNVHPVQVKDISIKTSLVKMPIFFNYYINTWSRFSFIVSAGTKLDLSVYQNVDYLSGVFGNQTKNRFEARPKPSVFNNLFYGVGLQYQYGKVAAQLTPYFDFTIRETNYYNPPKNFGINGSLRFQFTK